MRKKKKQKTETTGKREELKESWNKIKSYQKHIEKKGNFAQHVDQRGL